MVMFILLLSDDIKLLSIRLACVKKLETLYSKLQLSICSQDKYSHNVLLAIVRIKFGIQ